MPSTASHDSVTRRHLRRPKGVQWASQVIWRYGPGLALLVFSLVVGVPLVLGLAWAPAGHWLDREARAHDVGVALLEHVAVAALVAAAAYYWLFGFKRQWALRSYRRCACKESWELVDWALARPPKVRPTMVRLLADGIARSREPAVAVVQGRAGTGRTSFIAWLIPELAMKKLIPVPVLARPDGPFDVKLVKEAFCQNIDDVLETDEEVDAIWHRAKGTRDMVALIDGFDDEIVESMWHDDGERLRRAIRSLRSNNIAVVLASTRELPLGDIVALREDLDLFSREEARTFLEDEIRRTAAEDDGSAVEGRIREAYAAVDQLPDLVGDSFIAPFYLDVLLRLQRAGVLLDALPSHTDQWRATVLQRYLDAIDGGRIDLDRTSGDTGAAGRTRRAHEARKAAEEVACALTAAKRPDLMVAKTSLDHVKGRALSDARCLNLLWFGSERVGFAADDLGSYLGATLQEDSDRLLEDLQQVAGSPGLSQRADRHVLGSLIFWHLLHDGPARTETFRRFLGAAESAVELRPSVVAAAVRIAGTCGLDEFCERVEALARRCIEESFADDAQTSYGDELLGLVRALGGWQAPGAHRRLWQLAASGDVEVAWPAAKALAMATNTPEETLAKEIEDVLTTAEHGDPAGMSHPDDRLGSSLRSLAWILPALRGSGTHVEEQLDRVTLLCLDNRMSRLRGEMSLAQGLKLALLNDRAREANATHVGELLAGRRLLFWHARLVLVHALLATAWNRRDGAADGLKDQLRAVRSSEPHALVRRGVELANEGLTELGRAAAGKEPPLTRYMWTHERDAVRWVEQGRHDVSQLAGDVVLLSNMTYRLRSSDLDKAERAALDPDLPPCIADVEAREHIMRRCDCGRELCGSARSPVLEERAPFSESFCREQARVVARHGPPRWTKRQLVPRRRRRYLKVFWESQAEVAQPRRSE